MFWARCRNRWRRPCLENGWVLVLTALSMGLSVLMLVDVTATVLLNQDEGEDWVDALTNAVMIHRRGGVGYPGARFEPYLGQLQVVRTQLQRGDQTATYRAMNRLRHARIPGEWDSGCNRGVAIRLLLRGDAGEVSRCIPA